MKLQEFQARKILVRHGVPVPNGEVASTAKEARFIAEALRGPVVVKAQVLVGGRGKAGGVKLANNPRDAEQAALEILGMSIKGVTVRQVLVAQAVSIEQELYLGLTVDRRAKSVVVMASAEGGVEIEDVARETPDRIVKAYCHPTLGLSEYQVRELAVAIGLHKDLLRDFATIGQRLYDTMVGADASLIEINPLVVTSGRLMALDAKIVLDDNALYRHKDLELMRDLGEEHPDETEARQEGLSFVKLEGNIGCVVNGAGLAMATMDLVKQQGKEPANFLDIGGGARAESVLAALRIISSDPEIKAVLFNIFGGITRCDEVAAGIVAARNELGLKLPVVVRLQGTNAEQATQILAGADIIAATSMEEATRKVAALTGSGDEHTD